MTTLDTNTINNNSNSENLDNFGGEANAQPQDKEEFLKADFEEIKSLYDAGKYDELNKKISDIISKYPGFPGLEDFLNSEIGKQYKSKKYKKDDIILAFEEIRDLYDEGELSETIEKINILIETYGQQHPGVKDFLNNSEIAKKLLKYE